MPRKRSTYRNWLEFLPAWLLLKSLGLLPRRAAIVVGKLIARAAYRLQGRLRRTGHRNLTLAMPELSARERNSILAGVVDNLGRLLGEFSQFPKITSQNVRDLVVYDGFDNYRLAAEQGRGVLLLTGHIGAWELCAFAQGIYGHSLSFLIRPLDNPLLDKMIRGYRELSGNRTIDKNRAVKPVLETIRRGEDVGLLIDVNTVADQGVFCDFFGIPACSTTGLATFALRTGAPVVPGFLIWDERLKKHRLRFDPEVQVIRTGDFKEEVRLNTARFTKVIEDYARNYPDQWLWIHKRWHTRPEGEPDLYGPVKDLPAESASMKVEVEA
ncbi:MAG TPA: lysophospholipid acyltransferase family protein [Blastocatellia bacterium]|nr:lysophospholipid acyltransferase family protein [Blastocatellia bacterium]